MWTRKGKGKAYCKCYYENNKKHVAMKAKEYRAKIKLEVLSYYSQGTPKCAHCDITDIDVLCIDHIHGGGHEHRRRLGTGKGSTFHAWLKKNNYPKGYQVLCANCNLKKRIVTGK